MNRKYKTAIVLVLALIVTVTIALTRMGAAQQLFPTLYIDPPQVVFNSLVVGQRFDIDVKVLNVTDLKSYEFSLSFNPNMLIVVSESFLPEANLPTPNWMVDGYAGTFWANVTYDSPLNTVPPLTIATITFKISNYGISPLVFSNDKLGNSTGLLMSHQTIGGSVSVLNHDVAIVAVDASTNETYDGRLVNITTTAGNLGLASENFTISVYANSNLVGTSQVLNLLPNQTTLVQMSWNTSGFANMTRYVLSAQVSSVPYETNLANNALTDGNIKVKIMGDVNGDGTVGILDLEAWDAAYGSSQGMPNWNPQADLDGNGTVDKADGTLIIENYGNHL
jgi:uncharacterized protein (DUF2141 family)